MKHVKTGNIIFGIALSVVLSLLLTACPSTSSPTPTNPAPIANNDTAEATEGVEVTINVLANDRDTETEEGLKIASLDASKVTLTTAPSNGTAKSNSDGTISYTSNTGFTGSDSLKYTVADDKGKTSNEATVVITVSADRFSFATDPVTAYTRVDRMGMPAIGTAVITSKDDYNNANPSDDAALTFAGEIVTNVNAFHTALDDDLSGLGLTPCKVNPAMPLDPVTSNCITQAAPLVIPDTLKINAATPSGFPNGRKLADPVIDVTLAVILLDLSVDGQTAASLVGVNPVENDKAFLTAFPYLAEPHTP